jgi:acetylornithine/N-succinyldiaminopimelate aminotransferase
MKLDEFPAQALMEVASWLPLVFMRGKGSWLWDHEGRRDLDFVRGWAVNCLGHCPNVIAEALAEQSRKLVTPSAAFCNEPSMQLARRIVEHSCSERVFLTNSGAEANEGAIKLARAGAERIVGRNRYDAGDARWRAGSRMRLTVHGSYCVASNGWCNRVAARVNGS